MTMILLIIFIILFYSRLSEALPLDEERACPYTAEWTTTQNVYGELMQLF